MKTQKPYNSSGILLFFVFLFFCFNSIAAKCSSTVQSAPKTRFCSDVGPNKAIKENEIEGLCAKEQEFEKKIDRDFDLLKIKLSGERFNAAQVESLSKHMRQLATEFYRETVRADKRMKQKQIDGHRFIGRGPVFDPETLK